MISSLGLFLSRAFRRIVPDPFVIAVILAVLVAIGATAFGDFGRPAPTSVVQRASLLLDTWRGGEGLWKLLAFSMQMCLVLVTGYALAESAPVRRILARLAAVPRGTASAAALVGAVACMTALLNWGLGLIIGALLARDVAKSLSRRSIRAHYPLIVAAGYTGLMIWHGGLSGSAPLTMTTIESAQKVLPQGVLDRLSATGFPNGVPLTDTIFSSLNLFATGGLLVIIVGMLALLAPRRESDLLTIDALAPDLLTRGQRATSETPTTERDVTLPDRLDRSFLIMLLLALPILAAVIRFIWITGQTAGDAPSFNVARGFSRLSIDEVNAVMLAVGLLLHGSLRSYARAAQDAAGECVGIMLQFPLYAAITAMLVSSGLVKTFADAIARAGDQATLPLLTFIGACIVAFFIPSGGAQWGVQGPVAIESGLQVGVDPGIMVMSVAYGDQLTNMLQPFWALPLLAITKIKAREIVGYTALVMVVGGIWLGACLLMF